MKYSKLSPVLLFIPVKLGLLLFFPQTPATLSGKKTLCDSKHCYYIKQQLRSKKTGNADYNIKDTNLPCMQKAPIAAKRPGNTPIRISIK